MLRREFLKGLSLVGMGLAAPAVLKGAGQTKTSLLQQTKLSGKVSSAGNALPNVSVTDGFTVVVTDNDGNYSFYAHSNARFVYISIPAGHQIPHEESISQFYSLISHKGTGHQADFNVEKLKKADDKHGFVVWADPQIRTKKDAELLLANSAPDLKALVGNYPEGYLHGIGCGDLVWDNFSLFADYKKAIAMSGLPFFNVIGNHDMDTKESRSDDTSSLSFQEHFGPTYYSFNRGKVHYIVLDDVFFVGVDRKYIGYITENQLNWLSQDLQNVAPGSTIVLSLHIPTYTKQHVRNNVKEEMGGTVTNREKLYDLLKGYKVHIMSGHTHFNEVLQMKENITEHVHGTVCGAWWTGQICGDGTPNGYGVYEVDGDQISWYYKATGKRKDHQMRIYPAGKHPEFKEEVSINIWNYDQNWKISCFADGKSLGTPTQRTAFDPMAYDNMLGAELPDTRAWVEPNLTDHIFFIKAPAGTKKFAVEALDPFGNIYKEAIEL